MKVIFAGPSLHGSTWPITADLDMRGPAQQGDIFRAVNEGANVIGLIDGGFEQVAAVWHKEILHALYQGVVVFGAASMGALRAAECAAFGMIGIGTIFNAYAKGDRFDDADVAVLHGPREVDYLPLSEPLVNVHATLQRLRVDGWLDRVEYEALHEASLALFFKDRTHRRIVNSAKLQETRAGEILSLLNERRINLKLQDAEQLLHRVSTTVDQRVISPSSWTFAKTTLLGRL